MDTTAVVFDMDGVLVASGAHHRAAWQALLDELGEAARTAEPWRLTIGRPAEEAVGELLGRPVTAEEARRLARRKRDHYKQLLRRGCAPIPGATDFVRALARLGVPRGVATSASRGDVHRLLTALDVHELFGAIVTAEDVRRGKPDPEVYVAAATRLGVTAACCLVFEDSLVGIQAARAAGMRVIGLTTAHGEAELVAAGAERAIDDFVGLTWPV